LRKGDRVNHNAPIRRGHEIISILFDDILVEGYSWLAGGFARWALSPSDKPVPYDDVDIFCKDKDTYNYIQRIIDTSFECWHDNPACRSYKKNKTVERYKNIPNVQLIKPRDDGAVITMGEIETILENFDFTVTRAAIAVDPRDPSEIIGIVDEDFILDECDKSLSLKNIHCPISSTFRVIKYCRKGYSINIPEIFKLFADWDDRDDDYKLEMLELIQKEDITQDEIDRLERLLRID